MLDHDPQEIVCDLSRMSHPVRMIHKDKTFMMAPAQCYGRSLIEEMLTFDYWVRWPTKVRENSLR